MSVFDNKADHFNCISLVINKVCANGNLVAHIVRTDFSGEVGKIDHPLNDNYNFNANSTWENFLNRTCGHFGWSSNCTVSFVYVCVILDIYRD